MFGIYESTETKLEMQKINTFIRQYQQEGDKKQNRYSERGDVNDIMAMAFATSPKFSPLQKAQVRGFCRRPAQNRRR